MFVVRLLLENLLLSLISVAQTIAAAFEPERAKRWFHNNLNIFYHHFCAPIDIADKRHGGELVARIFRSHGVQQVFTLPGGHISPIITASEAIGIKIVDTRHEVTTVFAADACARLSGVPGVAIVTAGPGITNTVTAVKNAQMAESPIVVIGGAAAGLLKNRGALQDIEQVSLFRSITKAQYVITVVRDIVPLMREAFHVAASGTPGPVYVELPIDVLYPYAIVAKEVGSSTGSSKSLLGKIISWYLHNYLKNLFAGAFDRDWDYAPIPVAVPRATPAEMDLAVAAIREAKRPLLVLGSQTMIMPKSVPAIRSALESLGIPTYLGGMSRGLLGRRSPINMRQARRDALREADLIILCGSVVDFRLSYGRVLPRRATIIAINRNREQLYKNAGIFWQPSIAIQADPGSALLDIAARIGGSNFAVDPEWLGTLRKRDDEKEANASRMADQPADQHLNPLHVLRELEESLDPEKTILVADGGDFVGSAAYILRPRAPLTWLDPGAFGTLGVGAGFAIGAKICRPDHDVVIIFGDGSFGYSLPEFDTMVRHRLPVMAVIGNDACWTQIAREQLPMLGSDVSCRLAFCDYHNAVQGLGADGVKLDANDSATLRASFERAIARVRAGVPMVVNVLIGKTKFREGSISV